MSTMTRSEDTSFARLVSLACHDLRTPLATVHGFAKTLTRLDSSVDERTTRFLGMIEAASGQLADLLDDLALVARIEAQRYDPALREADTLELARAAAALVEEDRAVVEGTGATVETEPEAVSRALSQFARCVVRHGAVPQVELQVAGPRFVLAPCPRTPGRSFSARSCATSARPSAAGWSRRSAARSGSRTSSRDRAARASVAGCT